MSDMCEDCGGETENEGSACKGACSQARHYGEDVFDTKGLMTCNCCDDCREKCHESFMQSVADGEQD